MDLSRLLNPLGSDSEQAPFSHPEPITTLSNTNTNSTSAFLDHRQQKQQQQRQQQQQQHYYHDNKTDGGDRDRQEFIKSIGPRRHDRTSSVEQLGGLATLNIEGSHHFYRNQQLSPRHDYPSDGGGYEQHRQQHVGARPGLLPRPSWENNYFPPMDGDDRMNQDYHHYQQQRQQHHHLQQKHTRKDQQQQQQLEQQYQEQLTSPTTKRKYLEQSSIASFAKPSSFGFDSHHHHHHQQQQQDSDEHEDDGDDDEERDGGSSGTSNSNTNSSSSGAGTGASMNTATGNGGGGSGSKSTSNNNSSNDSSAGAAKRRRPLHDQFQESGDLPFFRQNGGQQQQLRQQQQQQGLFRDPVQPSQQQQYRQQQPQDRRNSGSAGGIGSSHKIEANPTEPGSLVAAVSSSSPSALSGPTLTQTKTQAGTAATGTTTSIPLTFERSGDGKIRCTFPRCGKEFSSESRLSTHIRIHSGKPPYPCDYPGCTKAFHTSSSLSHHRVVHSDQGLRPFVCRHERCGATYTQLARLITHQRTTHSGMFILLFPSSVPLTFFSNRPLLLFTLRLLSQSSRPTFHCFSYLSHAPIPTSSSSLHYFYNSKPTPLTFSIEFIVL
ncbi:hypothetical protein BKA57DRAFT_187375 [Linnemannia elongata]|nr:hypothetical protein BKA57DRAFT_187375 [Linnemannia elongata]